MPRQDRGLLRVEEGLLDRVRSQRAGNLVGGRGFLVAAEAAQQVGARRVEQVVTAQDRRTQLAHHGQSRGGTADFGQRDGAVERDYRRSQVSARIQHAVRRPGYLTSSPVAARPMIMRWISDVPSKIVKILASRCQRSTG
jgi:hypothetical protein